MSAQERETFARRLLGAMWRNYLRGGRYEVAELAREWKTTEANVREAVREAVNRDKRTN